MRLQIDIDERERNLDLLHALEQNPALTLIRKRLPCGDFIVGGRLLFERKTAGDFALSLMDGRLFTQAKRMSQSRLRPAWILEGDAKAWRTLNIQRPALQGALINLMLIFNLPVLRSTDPDETARLLIFSARQVQRAVQGGTYCCKRYGTAKTPQAGKLRLLQSLPGVGPERAQALLSRFGSVRACINANKNELLQVTGIGRDLAERIQRTVEETRGYYLKSNSQNPTAKRLLAYQLHASERYGEGMSDYMPISAADLQALLGTGGVEAREWPLLRPMRAQFGL